jgi:transposase
VVPVDPRPSYEELAAENAELRAMVEALKAQVAELTRRLEQNSQNSSRPPSSDSPFVKPEPKSLRRRSGRKRGGQQKHPGGACGATTCGTAPDGVTAHVQYGPRVTAIIIYFYVGQFLSKKRTAQALAELFGTPVSEGTVATMTQRAADGLDDFLNVIGDRIADTYPGVEHKLCCAHALRELQAVADAAPPDSDWCWADQAADALVAMQTLVAEAITAGTDTVDTDALNTHIQLYRSAAQIGIPQTAARRDAVMKKDNALARRLIDRQDDYLRLTTDPRIPADNNGSERDIRMIKLRQKVSGCLRTLTGAKQFCAIRSYLSTAAKHGRHFFDTLVMLAEGRPWLPATQ